MKRYVVLALMSLSGLQGCSLSSELLSSKSDVREVYVAPQMAKQALVQASSCCKDFSQLAFKPVKFDFAEEERVDAARQSIELNSGKSFVLAYQLPNLGQDYPVKVASHIGDTLFAPTVALLNSQGELVRQIAFDDFIYEEAEHFSSNQMLANFSVRQSTQNEAAQERYMVIYTTAHDLQNSTQIVHPLRTYAKAQNKSDPGLADPYIAHSAFGLVEVALNVSEKASIFSDAPLFTLSEDDETEKDEIENTVVLEPSVDTLDAAKVQITPAPLEQIANVDVLEAAKVKTSANMLSETETFYNGLISNSVARGDIEKALLLVEEAEKAGSRSARAEFIKAIKTQ